MTAGENTLKSKFGDLSQYGGLSNCQTAKQAGKSYEACELPMWVRDRYNIETKPSGEIYCLENDRIQKHNPVGGSSIKRHFFREDAEKRR